MLGYSAEEIHELTYMQVLKQRIAGSTPVDEQTARECGTSIQEGWTAQFILRTFSRGSLVRIEIEDNGPGMDEAVRRRAFEPFFSTKEPGMGTGLGLSVSYFIITDNHHGAMSVESTAGRGSTFISTLPVAGS